MAENGTRSALPALYTTTGAPGIEQYLVFIYIGVGFLVLLVVCLSVMLVIFVMKRNKMIRQMHPKHDLAGNLPNNDALARYYSLGMNDGASTLKSGLGTLTGKHSTLDRRSNASESVKLSSIHSPNHDSYVVKSNPLFKEEEDNNNAASSDKGYGSQENTATGTIVSEHLSSLNRRDSLDLNSSGSSFEHAVEIHGQQRPALSSHPIYIQDNLAFEDETQQRPESLAVEELDRALQQSGPSASESALKRISISRRAQISLNREALPPQPQDFSDNCSSSTADSDNESCDNISKLNSIPVIREGHTTPNCSDRRRNRARHSYENTDPFNDNAPLKPPKPPSLSPAARKLSIERHNLNVKLNVAIQGSNRPTAVVESGRPMPPPPPPSTLPPPLNVDSDNESTLTAQTGVYEDVDVKTPTGNPVDSKVQIPADDPTIPIPPPLPSQTGAGKEEPGDKPYGTVYNLDIPAPPAEIMSAPEPKSDTLRQALSPSSGVDNNVYDPMQFSAPPIIPSHHPDPDLNSPTADTHSKEYENFDAE